MPTTVLPWFTVLEGTAMVQVHVLEYSNSSPEPYAAGASGSRRCHIGRGVAFVDSAKEKNKARAVV